MRTRSKVALLMFPLGLGACERTEAPTTTLSDELRRDLAAASAPGENLAPALQSYQRMRFVSDVELVRAAVPARRPRVTRNHVHPTASDRPTEQPSPEVMPDPAESTVSEAPAPAAAAEASLPEPTMVIAERPTPDVVRVPAGEPYEGGVGERQRGEGLGGLLGGIIGTVVIRGGHGGVDKCDPRYDGRNRIPRVDRPDFGMPVPIGQTFPSARRR